MLIRLRPPLFLFALALLLGGCSSLSTLSSLLLGPSKTSVKSVSIRAMPEANGNLPTRLDLVFIYESDVAATLPKTGPEWFRQKTALLLSNPKKLEVAAFELPPETTLDPAPLPDRHAKALTVLAYADYGTAAGQAVINLTPFKRPLLRLDEDAILVEEQP